MSRYPGSYSDNRSRDPDAVVVVGEGGSIVGEVERQADAVTRGLPAMPLDTARAILARWSAILRRWDDPQLSQVARSLDELSAALAEDRRDGPKIGVLLTRLGMEARLVAADRFGPLGMGLDRLADGLIFAGTSLTNDYQ